MVSIPLGYWRILVSPEGHTTVLRKHPLDGDVPISCRTLLARVVRFAVDRPLSMHDARVSILDPHVALRSASDATGGDLYDNELMPCHDEVDCDDWDFTDVTVNPQVDVCAGPRSETSSSFASYAFQLKRLYLRTPAAS